MTIYSRISRAPGAQAASGVCPCRGHAVRRTSLTDAIGNTAVVGLPAEIFTTIGLQVKTYSPAEHTLVVSLANERFGYIPPADQANRGGYGEWPFMSRWFEPEAASMLEANVTADNVTVIWSTSLPAANRLFSLNNLSASETRAIGC